jgi:hypothetical protein
MMNRLLSINTFFVLSKGASQSNTTIAIITLMLDVFKRTKTLGPPLSPLPIRSFSC